MHEKIHEFMAREQPETPCLVVDLDMVEANYRQIAELGHGMAVFYAVKANPAPAVLERLAGAGASFDAASRAEIAACLAAGATPDRISFGNTVKKVSDIAFAVAQGVDLFAFDSSAELEKLAQAAPGARVYCRIIVENHGARWPLSRKFGCHPSAATDLLVLARDLGLVPCGLSFHVGSQQQEPEKWRDAIAVCAGLFEEARGQGIDLDILNIGGGYPIRYRNPNVPDLAEVFAEIDSALNDNFGGDRPQMMMEPGRAVVGPAGMIRSEVLLVTERRNGGIQRWVFLDIGKFGGLAESEGEAIQYRMEMVCPDGDGGSGNLVPSVLAGPTCDGHDILYEHELYDLPAEIKAGDFVDILDGGAYTTTYASIGFNGFAPLKEFYL